MLRSFAAVAVLALATPAVAPAVPANDDFAAAKAISGTRGSTSDANIGAGKEPGEPNHAGFPGGASIWFRWTAPEDRHFSFTTQGSFDTLLAVYEGSSVSTLIEVASDDDSGLDEHGGSALSFAATAGSTYHVAVDGFGGKYGAVDLRWQRAPANDNFENALELAGASGNVSASGTGATTQPGEPIGSGPSVWYRWTAPSQAERTMFAVPASGAAVTVYTGSQISSLERVTARSGPTITFVPTPGTIYRIRVEWGSSRFELAWSGPPPNDSFPDALRLVGRSGSASGSNIGATRDGPRFPAASVWYRWRALASGRVVLSTARANFDTVLAVYRGRSLQSARRIGFDDDSGFRTMSRLVISVVAGTTYRIAVGGFDVSEVGRFDVRWSFSPPV